MSDPIFYDVEDYETGKRYRVEAYDADATYDEAVDFIGGLSEEERATYEYNPQTTEPERAAAPQPEVSAPVPVSTETTQSVQDVVRSDLDQTLSGETEQPLSDEEADEYRRLVSDLDVPEEAVAAWVRERGNVWDESSSQDLQTYREAIRAGEPVSGNIDYVSIPGQIARDLAGGWSPQVDPTLDGDIETSVEAGMAYNPMGIGTRLLDDWFDNESLGYTKDSIRGLYPELTDAQVELVHDNLRAEARRREIANARAQLDYQDVGPVTEFLGDIVGGASPVDLIPIGRGATFSSRLVTGAVENAYVDAALQGYDVYMGAQDEYNYGQTFVAGAAGAAFQGGIEAGARVVNRGVRAVTGDQTPAVTLGRRPPGPSEPLRTTVQVPTTTDRRTSAYRQELDLATNQAVHVVDEVTSNWVNRPEIEVHSDFRKLKDVDNDALGVYQSDGRVALNTEAIINEAKLRRVSPEEMIRSVTFHEALGHHGLASRYGEDLDTTLEVFYDRGDTTFRQRVEDWMARNPDAYTTSPRNAALSDENWRIVRATEEVLAEISENEGLVHTPFGQALVNKLRDWARRVGVKDFDYSDGEIRALLGIAQQEVIKGAPSQGGGEAPKYMVTYHGSGADFDRFDHSFMSSGEGAQVFGWGTYLSESRGIAESYKDALGRREYSWGGKKYDTLHEANIEAMDEIARFLPSDDFVMTGKYLDAASHAINVKARDGEMPYPAPEDFFDDMAQLWPAGGNDEAFYSLRERFSEGFQPIYDLIDKKMSVSSRGKLYEVELPDNMEWLEWEEPLNSQPTLSRALESNGYFVVDYNTWNMVNRDAAMARLEYQNIRERVTSLDEMIQEAQEKGGLQITREEFVEVGPEELAQWEAKVKELFPEMQLADVKKQKEVSRAQRYFHDEMDGETVYQTLSTNLGSPQEASALLASSGVGGNRYLANNVRKNRSRANDGTDTFNYAVFDDETPSIVNKYMRPKNKADDSIPLREEDLTPDELFDSLNALEQLEAITKNEKLPPMSFEQMADEAAARGVTASEFLRRNPDNPGDLSRRMFMYDIAARKLDDKLSGLNARINSGQYTMRDKENYVKTLMQFEDLTARIFDLQSEAGRMLRAVQEQQYTRKRVTTIRDLLRGLNNGMEGLEDPATFEKFARTIGRQLEENKKLGEGGKPIIQMLNVPRALMSSYDLSAPLRQGLFFITKGKYWTGFARMFGYFGSNNMFEKTMSNIVSDPNYGRMVEGNVAFSHIEGSLSAREESFQTDLAQEIPIIGRGVRASERAYVGFLNKLRADMFNSYLSNAEKAGINVDDPEFLRGLGAFVNAGTGRGNLPDSVQSMAPQLNALFFSPRLMSSRINLLNPVWYARLPPGVRGQAIQSALAFGGVATLALNGIQMMFPDVEVGTDPRSSDFGKVIVGNTRYDVLGGFSQYLTFFARMSIGQRASSSGRVSEYKSTQDIEDAQEVLRGASGIEEASGIQGGPYQQSLGGAMLDFARSKSSPNASYVYDMVTGEDFIGDPTDPAEGIIQRMIPMFFQDVNDAVQEYGPVEGVIRASPGIFGVGSSTYVVKSLDPDQVIEAPEQIQDEDIADGENEYVSFRDGVGTLTPRGREEWGDRINVYFSQIMEYEMSDPSWANLSDEERAELISEARTEAKREARKDMLDYIGVD